MDTTKAITPSPPKLQNRELDYIGRSSIGRRLHIGIKALPLCPIACSTKYLQLNDYDSLAAQKYNGKLLHDAHTCICTDVFVKELYDGGYLLYYRISCGGCDEASMLYLRIQYICKTIYIVETVTEILI